MLLITYLVIFIFSAGVWFLFGYINLRFCVTRDNSHYLYPHTPKERWIIFFLGVMGVLMVVGYLLWDYFKGKFYQFKLRIEKS